MIRYTGTQITVLQVMLHEIDTELANVYNQQKHSPNQYQFHKHNLQKYYTDTQLCVTSIAQQRWQR